MMGEKERARTQHNFIRHYTINFLIIRWLKRVTARFRFLCRPAVQFGVI